MMKTRFGRFVGYEVALGILAAVGAAGCIGEVMVGDVEGTGGESGGTGGASSCESCAGAGQIVDCADHDQRTLAAHARWKATDNDFGQLAESRWLGAFSNGLELELVVTGDHEATLQVGQPVAPPMQDTAYVEVFGGPLPDGALYEIHGAGFDGTDLLVPLPLYAQYEEWCPLQLAYPYDDSDCEANLLPGEASCAGEVCTANGRTVSEGYITLTGANPCACTLTECVANVDWPEWEAGKTYADYQNYFSVEALVLSYDPVADTLSGGVFEDGSPPDGMAAELQRAD